MDRHHLAALDQADEDVRHHHRRGPALGQHRLGDRAGRRQHRNDHHHGRRCFQDDFDRAPRSPRCRRRTELAGYVESNGYVAIEAEHFTQKMDRGGAEWRVFKQLGRNGDSVKVLPDVSPSITSNLPTTSPELDYKIYFFSTGTFPVTVYRIPTLNTTGACRLAHWRGQRRTANPHRRAFDVGVQVGK